MANKADIVAFPAKPTVWSNVLNGQVIRVLPGLLLAAAVAWISVQLAAYTGTEPRLTKELLDRAALAYFVDI